ncbi:hypothetical protein SARC_07649 [Sphaeroforma arctica JP610]|uniref:Uncharacterized protein n=1 Tax=Sphaeroforma arctica JP610 TaxID=667725 RepID=A0A0L0FTF4_9EUKA|nr:hypothetical protein SARC_07649 [Sphaeroforma arctica JP610]KNC79979.1 hypothetical protein SARC_07649 [Sphaeroforma arctica JP610]|eukprot:XP_014153881.1 hypothetical protein SARC_07649 [Sphaeroforma arctica JP610]
MNNITDLTGEDGPDPEEQQMRIAQVLSTIESICATDTDKANTADDNQSATDTLDEDDMSQWAVLEGRPLLRKSSLSSEGSLTENGIMPTSRGKTGTHEPGNRTHAGTTLLRPVSATEAEQMLKAVGWDVEQAVIELTEAQEEVGENKWTDDV